MIRNKLYLCLLLVAAGNVIAQKKQAELPEAVQAYIQTLSWPELGGQNPVAEVRMVS